MALYVLYFQVLHFHVTPSGPLFSGLFSGIAFSAPPFESLSTRQTEIGIKAENQHRSKRICHLSTVQQQNQAESEYKHSLTFSVRLCCHSNETRAPIANPSNSAQLECTPYTIHPTLYIWVRAVVLECGERQSDKHTYRYTDTQTVVTNTDFDSAIRLTLNAVMPIDENRCASSNKKYTFDEM